jgi:hypothetical protein
MLTILLKTGSSNFSRLMKGLDFNVALEITLGF